MSAAERPVSNPMPPAARSEYLTFNLGAESYAIDILKVQEIRAFEGATRIAGAPPFIRGVINLRGAIVPVVDLRLRFGVGDMEDKAFSVLIVLQFGRRQVGVVVDGVSDVVVLGADEIQPAPEFASLLGSRHIRGLAGVGGQMLVVLDIEGLMLAPDMALVDAAAGGAEVSHATD